MSKILRIFAIFAAVVVLNGCNDKPETVVKKIKIVQGANQCAPLNSECKKDLLVELIGPTHHGLFGGKGSSYPVPDIPVRFEVEKGSDLTLTAKNSKSDQGGTVTLNIKTGNKTGDQYFKIIPEGFPKAAVTVRVISGVKLSGGNQEGFAGHELPEPLSLTVYGKNGKPASGVPVYFHLVASPEKKVKGKFTKSRVLTNSDGVAETEFQVGTDTGTYKLQAEVSDPDRGISYRAIEFKALGINIFGFGGLVLTVLGGLAIFIYGLKLMTDGLQIAAGDKMKKILHFFTSNRITAILAGTVVTGVIQSSSACTVMVVGFVNAGLLNLEQAIGVVFGANIGTTVTAQVISFKLGKIALPAITVGLIVMMLSKRSAIKGWASTLMGFGMLFFGLGIMSHELKLIKHFPSIIAFFKQFDCSPLTTGGYMPITAVLGAIAIGTFMTVIIQSSSATIGIAIALASSGLINFYTVVPLILGDNIGTTVTANLAALGANRRSKQTAFAHFIFNLFGTSYMVALFYIPYHGYPIYLYFVNSITPGNAFLGENIVRHIAMAHSMFNVFNVILFLPFIAVIARVCNWVIPIKEGKKDKIELLEPHLIQTPSIAIGQTIQSIRSMVNDSWSMVTKAMNECFLKSKVDSELSAQLAEEEDEIDDMQKSITKYLVKITEQTLSEPQAAIIPLLMHCTNDAEKIADHTENILALTKRMEENDIKLSSVGQKDINDLWSVLKDQARHVITALESTDKKEVSKAIKDDIEIDKLADRLEHNHVERLNKGKCDVEAGLIFLEIISELEKIGSHLANIADRTVKIQKHHMEIGS